MYIFKIDGGKPFRWSKMTIFHAIRKTGVGFARFSYFRCFLILILQTFLPHDAR